MDEAPIVWAGIGFAQGKRRAASEGAPEVIDVLRAALAVAVMVAVPSLQAADLSFQVVVHPSVAGAHVPRSVLAAIFLGNATRWGDRNIVLPIDQSLRAPVRQAFAQQVLGQSIDALQAYWLRKMMDGKTAPPRVKSSDADVLEYVASHEGAIGYVSAGTPLPATVKSLTIVD
jgi:hypothetical protein